MTTENRVSDTTPKKQDYSWHGRGRLVLKNTPRLDFCPHCGSTDVHERSTVLYRNASHGVWFYIECARCGCRTGDCATAKTARRDWNRRAQQPMTTADVREDSEDNASS